jgi:lipopolysaccharide export system protein LptC
MSRQDTRTRTVFWLKVLLPLVALGLLSTLFLIARTADPDLAIRYADVDVAQLSKEEQVAGPAYSGVTRDGASITLTAESVRPDAREPARFDARTVSGVMILVSGLRADLTAPTAELDPDRDVLRFEGGVTILSSEGHTFETEILSTALGATEIVAETEIRATGPDVELDAGSMRVTQDEAGGYVAVFNGGVRLLYTPPQPRE